MKARRGIIVALSTVALAVLAAATSHAQDKYTLKAPSGIACAEDDPTVHRVSQPSDAARASTSRAIRLFPTPDAPQMRTPATSEAEIAASMVRISSERPINGHDNRTQRA